MSNRAIVCCSCSRVTCKQGAVCVLRHLSFNFFLFISDVDIGTKESAFLCFKAVQSKHKCDNDKHEVVLTNVVFEKDQVWSIKKKFFIILKYHWRFFFETQSNYFD